jgi:hypothetical protein
MVVGILLLVAGMFLIFMMREAPTAAAIAAIPLLLPGIVVLSVDFVGSIETDVKEHLFVFMWGAMALYAIYFWLKVLLKSMFK